MPFASIAGVTYAIQNPGATELEPEPIGQVRRMFTGGARNSVRAQARGWSMTTVPILEADFLTLYANTAKRKFVTCNGDFLDSVATLCWVQITNAQYFKPYVGAPLMRIVALEIHEVDPATTAFAVTPYQFLLTSVVSPDDAAAFVSTPDGFYPGDAGTNASLGVALVPPTSACPVMPAAVYSPTPEIEWLSVPLDNGYAFGKPSVRIEVGSGIDPLVWALASTKGRLYLKRAGSLIAGPWDSNYVGNFGLLGASTQFMNWSASLSLTLIAGDQFLLQFFTRLQLQCGQADDAVRPSVYYGAVPGPRQNPVMFLSGSIVSL